MARFLAGRYGRRLERLEELGKRIRLEQLAERWLRAVDASLTAEQLRLVVEASGQHAPEVEAPAAWQAYTDCGAFQIDREIAALCLDLPQDEYDRITQSVWEDPRVSERLRPGRSTPISKRGGIE